MGWPSRKPPWAGADPGLGGRHLALGVSEGSSGRHRFPRPVRRRHPGGTWDLQGRQKLPGAAVELLGLEGGGGLASRSRGVAAPR